MSVEQEKTQNDQLRSQRHYTRALNPMKGISVFISHDFLDVRVSKIFNTQMSVRGQVV